MPIDPSSPRERMVEATVAEPCRRYPAGVSRNRPPTGKGAQKGAERERAVGLEPDDAAAEWLEENDPAPRPQPPKAATKSKLLHQWRQRQQRGG
jgi:hypothetical protein